MAHAASGTFDDLDKVRKALKHARIKRDRVPKDAKEAKQKAEERVAALEKQRDELYEQLGRRTASKLEEAQADHAGGADLVRRAMSMLQTGLSRMEGAQRDTFAAASPALADNPGEAPPVEASTPEPDEQRGKKRKARQAEEPSPAIAKRQRQAMKITQPMLEKFVDIFLAFASEALGRIEGDQQIKEKYVARMASNDQQTFRERRRCTFSWMTDTTTLAVIRPGIAPNLADPANALYNIVVAVVALNSRARYEALAPLELAKPLAAAEFKAKFEPLFGRRAPPKALLQGVRCTLGRYGKGNHFDNCAEFVEDMGRKCPAAWAKIDAARAGGDASDAVLAVLRKDLGLGPFSSIVAARLLALIDPRLYDYGRADLGQFARMGLGLLTGMDARQARAFSTTRAQAKEADALFAQLCAQLPAALREREGDGIVDRLAAHHLQPLVAQTVEHMLCEFRKMIVCERRDKGGSRTTDAEYAALWRAAAPVYGQRGM